MAFFNDRIIVVTDSSKNIFTFQWKEGSIISYFFNKKQNKVQRKEIVKDALGEFDVAINENDYIYLVYQNKYKELFLFIFNRENQKSFKMIKKFETNIHNLNIVFQNETVYIFNCELLNKEKKIYRIYHHCFRDNKINTNIVDDIKVKKILNPFQVAYDENKIILGYYDLFRKEEEIFIKSFDLNTEVWLNKMQLTFGQIPKMYIDFLLHENKLYLTYSEYFEGNLVIKYEKFLLDNNKLKRETEKVLSNPENCHHPTLVLFHNKLWVCWIEYNNLISSYTVDEGENWGPLYMWKESKSNDIVRYKFLCSQKKFNFQNKLNFSFGKVKPNISFMGFGPLRNVIKIPLKKKIIYKSIENIENNKQKEIKNEIKFLKNYINELENRILILEKNNKLEVTNKKLNQLEERLIMLEKFIQKRTRSSIFRL